ncbi:hypothetical protein ACFXPT_38360 [Streptomyces goshikiensis]|uniref:hypothetical protein n=1 Tax=Streptomyces goshikiensis TaxID=1942 RepID=UPI00369E31AA
MTITQYSTTGVQSLISPELRALLIKDVGKTWPDLTDDLCEHGVNQTAAFLATSTRSDEPLTPSLRWTCSGTPSCSAPSPTSPSPGPSA